MQQLSYLRRMLTCFDEYHLASINGSYCLKYFSGNTDFKL